MRRQATALIAVTVALVAAGPSSAAEPRTSLPDVEDEVMCVQCKTPLNLSTAPVAERERAFIRREIAKGRTKEQIKDDLVGEFGPAVLATPQDEGFGLAGWLVPIAVALAALVAVVAAARRWRRSGQESGAAGLAVAAADTDGTAAAADVDGTPVGADAAAALDDAETWRLDRELSAFDKRGRT